jgi:hypothetical protein
MTTPATTTRANSWRGSLNAVAGMPGSGEGAGDRHRVVVALTHPLSVGAVVAAATGYVAAVDPSRSGHYPLCPIRAVTGLYCPGCGGLRAVHELTHGHLLAAMSSNVLVVLGIPVVIVLWAIWAHERLLGRSARRWRLPRWSLVVIPAVLVAFAVLRNLSGMHWLAP